MTDMDCQTESRATSAATSISTSEPRITEPSGSALIMSEQYYVAVKGSLHSSDSAVFGLEPVEVTALTKRFRNSHTEVINGILVKGRLVSDEGNLRVKGEGVVGVSAIPLSHGKTKYCVPATTLPTNIDLICINYHKKIVLDQSSVVPGRGTAHITHWLSCQSARIEEFLIALACSVQRNMFVVV